MPAAAPVGKKRSKRNANHGGDSGSGSGSSAKKQKINKTKSKVVSTNEVEELSADVDTWDWSEVKTSNAKLTDDMTGFLCLEEIDDVQVEYEMDAARGKVAKFKVRNLRDPGNLGQPRLTNDPFSVSRKPTVNPEKRLLQKSH